MTERIRLTTSVLIAPLHTNTALLAKQAASLDRLSGGTLITTQERDRRRDHGLKQVLMGVAPLPD